MRLTVMGWAWRMCRCGSGSPLVTPRAACKVQGLYCGGLGSGNWVTAAPLAVPRGAVATCVLQVLKQNQQFMNHLNIQA